MLARIWIKIVIRWCCGSKAKKIIEELQLAVDLHTSEVLRRNTEYTEAKERLLVEVLHEYNTAMQRMYTNSSHAIGDCLQSMTKQLHELHPRLLIAQEDLHSALEHRRQLFPKLWIIDNLQLLHLVSPSTTVQTVRPYLELLFPGVRQLQLEGTKIIGVSSASGETLKLLTPVDTTLDTWLLHLDQAVTAAMKHATCSVVQAMSPVTLGTSPFSIQLLESFPAQLLSVGLHLIWTDWVEGAMGLPPQKDSAILTGSRRPGSPVLQRLSTLTSPLAMSSSSIIDSKIETTRPFSRGMSAGSQTPGTPNTSKLNSSSLSTRSNAGGGDLQGKRSSIRPGSFTVDARMQHLTSQLIELLHCRLDPVHRASLESLVTEQVQLHQTWQLELKHLRDPTDFSWQQQIRYYWRKQEEKCVIQVGDITNEYGSEFLPQRNRPILAPDSVKAFVVLSQALSTLTRLGAVSGNPEIISELGYLLGRWVTLHICTEKTTAQEIASVIASVVASGAWGILQDINRLPLVELPEVIGQIQSALAAINDPLCTELKILGRRCLLRAGFGLFATIPNPQAKPYNPEMADFYSMSSPQPNLSDSLRDVITPFTVRRPEQHTVIWVHLAAHGFQNSRKLATKLDALLSLSAHHLPSRDHYDFGSNFARQVIEVAGIMLRNAGTKHEDLILCRAVSKVVVPRLHADDLQIFLNLLTDVFPNAVEDETRFMQLEDAIQRSMDKLSLGRNPGFSATVLQLYNAQLNRAVVAVVGNSGVGKTSAIRVLKDSLGAVLAVPHVETRFSPRAVPASQLFGDRGLVPSLQQHAAAHTKPTTSGAAGNRTDSSAPFAKPRSVQWLVADGSIDNSFLVEALSVVGGTETKLFMETDSLAGLDPAALANVSVMYVAEDILRWDLLLEHLVSSAPANVQGSLRTVILPLWAKHLPEAHRILLMGGDLTLSLRQCARNAFHVLSDLFVELAAHPEAHAVEQAAWYALIWGIGGSVDTPGRDKLDRWARTHLSEFPEHDTVFEYFVDIRADGRWRHWNDRVQQPASAPVTDARSFVACLDSVRLSALVTAFHAQGLHVLISGDRCSGKSRTISTLVRGGSLAGPIITTAFTSTTTCANVTKFLHTKFAGHPEHTLLIEDMHRPASEPGASGARTALEVVRQLITSGGCWIGDQHAAEFGAFDWLILPSAQVVGLVTGSGNVLPARLRGAFVEIYQPDPLPLSVGQILQALTSAMFPSSRFPQEVCDAADSLPSLIAECWAVVYNELGTALPHINLNALFRVMRGMGLCFASQASTLLQSWLHESERSFGDSIDNIDRKHWIRQALLAKANAIYAAESQPLRAEQPLFFNKKAGGDLPEFTPVSLSHVKDSLLVTVTQFNILQPPGTSPLVLFPSAVAHVMRVLRTLALPGASMLLLGPAGVGKRSTALLAAHIARAETAPHTGAIAEACRTGDVGAFDAALAALYRAAAVPGKRFVTIVELDNIPDAEWLERITAWISSGPLALPIDFLAPAVEARERLHFIFTLSGSGSELQRKIVELERSSPAIFAHCEVDSFTGWTEEAYQAVAEQLFANIVDGPPQGEQERMIQALAQLYSRLQENLPVACYREAREHVAYPPAAFARICKSFSALWVADRTKTAATKKDDTTYLETLERLLRKVQQETVLLDARAPSKIDATLARGTPTPDEEAAKAQSQSESRLGMSTSSAAATDDQGKLATALQALQAVLSAEADRMRGAIATAERVSKGAAIRLLTAATFAGLCGPLDAQFRAKLLDEIADTFESLVEGGEGGQPPRLGRDIASILQAFNTDEVVMARERVTWYQSGMPTDYHTNTNLLLLFNATANPRVPLVFASSGHTKLWFKEPDYTPVDGSDPNFLFRVTTALESGRTVVVFGITPNLQEEVSSLVDFFNARRVAGNTGEAPSPVINLRQKHRCAVHPNSELVLVTESRLTEAFAALEPKLQFVHWAANPAFIEHFATAVAVVKDHPECFTEAQKFVQLNGQGKQALRQATSRLQQLLHAQDGIVGQNPELLHQFITAVSRAAHDVADSLNGAEAATRKFLTTADEYKPFGTRAATIWAAASGAVNLPFGRFVDHLELALQRAPFNSMAQRRVADAQEMLLHCVAADLLRTLPDNQRISLALALSFRLEEQDSGLDPLVTLGVLYNTMACFPAEQAMLTDASGVGVSMGAPGLSHNKSIVSAPSAIVTSQSSLHRSSLGPGAIAEDEQSKTPSFLTPNVWDAMQTLGSRFDAFKPLCDSVQKKPKPWKAWWATWKADVKAPDLEKISKFERLLLARFVREDRTLAATQYYLKSALGDKLGAYVSDGDNTKDQLKGIVADTNPKTPVICYLQRGIEVYDTICAMAQIAFKGKKKAPDTASLTVIFDGPDKIQRANEVLQQGLTGGGWVVLRNCFAGAAQALEEIASSIASCDSPNPDFRLFITTHSFDNIPSKLKRHSISFRPAHPRGIKQRMLGWYSSVIDDRVFAQLQFGPWRTALFGLLFVAALVRERAQYACVGIPSYNPHVLSSTGAGEAQALLKLLLRRLPVLKEPTNTASFTSPSPVPSTSMRSHRKSEATNLGLEDDVESRPSSPTKESRGKTGPVIPWDTLRFLASQVVLGGSISDPSGQALLTSIAEYFLNGDVLQPGMQPCSGYGVPLNDDYGGHCTQLQGYPAADRPEALCLNGNTDIHLSHAKCGPLYRELGAMYLTRPEVANRLSNLARKNFVSQLTTLIETFPNVVDTPADKKGRPLLAYLSREITQFNSLVTELHEECNDLLRRARNDSGAELDVLLDSSPIAYELLLQLTPLSWQQRTWPCSALSDWLTGMQCRYAQLELWLSQGSPPPALWIGGLVNPTELLEALKQETTRAHPNDEDWSYEKLTLRTTFTGEAKDVVRAPPEGIMIQGLFADGFSWNRRYGRATESPDALCEWKGSWTSPLPVVHITVGRSKELVGVSFRCPVYADSRRERLLFHIDIPCDEDPQHWYLRAAVAIAFQPQSWPLFKSPPRKPPFPVLRPPNCFFISQQLPKLGTACFGFRWTEPQAREGEAPYDLDVITLCLGQNSVLYDTSNLVYYGNPTNSTRSVLFLGDARRAGGVDRDDETVEITLGALPPDVQEVRLFLALKEARQRGHELCRVPTISMRMYAKNTGQTAFAMELQGREFHLRETSVEFGKMLRIGVGKWKFEASKHARRCDWKQIMNLFQTPLTKTGHSLDVNQTLDLSVAAPATRKLRIEISWEQSNSKSGGTPYTLNLAAFGLNASGLLLSADHAVYFAQPSSPDRSVQWHQGETLTVNLHDATASEIKIYGILYKAAKLKHTLSNVKNERLRVFDADTGSLITEFVGDSDFGAETAAQFGSLLHQDGRWYFRATREGSFHTFKQLRDRCLPEALQPARVIRQGERIPLANLLDIKTPVVFGLGWDAPHGESYDLDAVMFCLGRNGRLVEEKALIYYDNLQDPSGAISLSGDSRDGQAEGDDEQITVDFTKISPLVRELRLYIVVFDAKARKQSLKGVQAYARVFLKNSTAELARYNVDPKRFTTETAVEVVRITREGTSWQWAAVGKAEDSSLEQLESKFSVVA
eukprot:TRINITY_DN2201_c0_g1_i4.p1 TRINITY_DN2201_c0_g1~~TRINITY_DN2201_c0_g1_i4.p1  ORF type:complete len:3572 (-),score=436.55 TRINITY_DN2201_c0_g1_i4:37-10752(-)